MRAGQRRPAKSSGASRSDFPAAISVQIQRSTARLPSISGEANPLLLSACVPLKYVPRIRLEDRRPRAPASPANSFTAPLSPESPHTMSSNAPIHILVASRPPSREAVDLDLQYRASASVSGSESAGSPPPDSPPDRGCAALPPLDLKLAQRQHATGPYSSSTSSYSPSPTNSEFAQQPAYGRPMQPHVQTVPVIPTLLPMPSLEGSVSATPSEAGRAKERSGEEHRLPSAQLESQTGPSRARSKPSSEGFGLASVLDQTTPYNSSHPYARIYTRKEGAKRRKMWNHAHEKSLFTPQEM